MTYNESHIAALLEKQQGAKLKVYTLGKFNLELEGQMIQDNWGRDKAIQLFQFLLLSRNRAALHKEQIIDRLWEDAGTDQDFKVALHGINKTLEPNKKSRGNSQYLIRQGSSYKLNTDLIWIDSMAFEEFIQIGNSMTLENPSLAIVAFQFALGLYEGSFLPNRIYNDWTSMEREKLQLMAVNAMMSLGTLFLDTQPSETLRLAQDALAIDPTWEQAYRLQMQAYLNLGNRPQAIKTFKQCCKVLEIEYGIDPLPETKKVLETIKSL